MARREWLKMEYADGSAYALGTVLETAGGEWILLHCVSETASLDRAPAGVDVGTLVYMRGEGISYYGVHFNGAECVTVTSLGRLEAGVALYRGKGPILTSGEIRDRVYLPWHLWRDLPLPRGWHRPDTTDIPYRMETLIYECGTVKRRRSG
jgi:hypothetical protein